MKKTGGAGLGRGMIVGTAVGLLTALVLSAVMAAVFAKGLSVNAVASFGWICLIVAALSGGLAGGRKSGGKLLLCGAGIGCGIFIVFMAVGLLLRTGVTVGGLALRLGLCLAASAAGALLSAAGGLRMRRRGIPKKSTLRH